MLNNFRKKISSWGRLDPKIAPNCQTENLSEDQYFNKGSGEPISLVNSHYDKMLEAERKQIAAYLNDFIVQSLTALHIQLSLLPQPTLSEESQETLGEALSMIIELVDDVRNKARSLRPLELDIIGLKEALKQACVEFGELTGIKTIFEGPPDVLTLDDDKTLAFFRLVQEAFSNIYNQGEATEVSVQLSVARNYVTLAIQDNGNEISPPGNLDLKFISFTDRFQQLGGFLEVHARSSQETRITAVLPC